MSEFIAQLFTDFTTTDSLIVLAFLFGAFLIGLFSGRASRSGLIKKLRKENQQQARELAALKTKEEGHLQLIASQEADLQRQAEDLKKAEAQIEQVKQESHKYYTDWQSSQKQAQQLADDKVQYQNQLAALEETVTQAQEQEEHRLREQVLQWEKGAAEQRTTIATLQQEKRDLLAALNEQQEQLNAVPQGEPQTTDMHSNRLELIEEKITSLEKENQQLQAAIADLQEEEEAVGITFEEDEIIEVQEGTLEEVFVEPAENTEAYAFVSSREKVNIAKATLKKHFGEKLPLATANQKDPLQELNGIGPFIEEQLNGIGIYTFAQISQFDDEIIDLVTNAIEFFPGRIKRDNWQGQASQRLTKDEKN